MRTLKIMLTILVVCSITVLSLSCASESEEAGLLENQVVAVQRGDLTVDITAVGNLALSRTEDLAFDLFYQEGTVEEVLVEEGESVEEGQVLAKLDTSEWEEQLEALEDQLTTAERQLTATERQLTAAERQLTTKERDLLQAEINLKNAEVALEKAEDSWLDTVSAGEEVMRLEKRLEWYLENDPEDSERIEQIREDLGKAWDVFLRVTSDSLEAGEVTAKEMGVELAQARLEDVQIAIEDAQVEIDDARQDVEDAQEELDEAKSDSPEVTAPFAGFITKVNVEGGDEVLKGTVAVQLADPNKFEADIMVSEMDIFQVKLGGSATVQVDAMPIVSLPAKVTHISPTATIQSGVVNYEVKVEVESLEEVVQKRQGAGQEAAQGQVPTMLSEGFQLREGLTVTVSIIVVERSDVLLVPNSAITSSGRQTYVQVVSPDGAIEERVIQTGISDWQYTEVTDGLSEGEQVVVLQGTTTTPSTSQEGPSGGIRIPGMGGGH